MSTPTGKSEIVPGRRRYLVHLCSARDECNGAYSYIARIQPWTARISHNAKVQQRVFTDECEFIETVNSLLPDGSDVRNIFSHIESLDGFHYLLFLTPRQAECLGWINE
jgi:hypothetical protein